MSDDCSREDLQADLIETMKNFHGIGLSAPQCGIMERMFVMYKDFRMRKTIGCFNPKILDCSKQEILMDEGCLTYPGLWLKINRPENVLVEYEDIDGKKIEHRFRDIEARVFQHEMDHMEGADFLTKVSKLKLKMALKRMHKQAKKASRINSLA
ncbi:uncharacterized protein METZ01_LOCUS92720 [marine metagenome]|uniref:Peptide deformylase n=1 Tax=marine metagenome TaxID=408172 RepID=A0A381VHN0_9ZZZZ